MLLSPDATYQPACFPSAEQLGRQEREALVTRLPGLGEAMRRITHSYLGNECSASPPDLLWQPADPANACDLEGPTLVTKFGQASQMLIRVPRPLAARCISALLGYPPPSEPVQQEITSLDLAVLQPYLESLADCVLRTLLHTRGQHELLPSGATQPLPSPEMFGLMVSLATVSSQHHLTIITPVAAWRAELEHSSGASKLQLHREHIEALPVRLKAVLPTAALSLIEIQTMEPGDLLPLPANQQMMVQT